ncbi:unnamed protein product [Paramecium sonneborni]|uniref:Uncharacterized protein n=1 Tax=Paramecium sonneborni TaxID=65129 RepID=A0A8S1NMM4_9CILI|nr:unnamed protein product [Paramecium sonneborni]
MIQQKFNRLIVFLLLLQSALCEQTSKICVCGHIQNQDICQKSSICIWNNEKCILKLGSMYLKSQQDSNQCQNYGHEECRKLQHCGFHLGKCVDFQGCSIYHKNNCQSASFQCVSDGQICIEIRDCNNYKSQIECNNKSKKGNFCVWKKMEELKCQEVQKCEDLPIYLSDHKGCNEALEGCTVNNIGQGCINQMESCTDYMQENQCYTTLNTKQICFWQYGRGKCLEKKCDNFGYKTDYECKSQLNECTTNGIHCVIRTTCKNAKSEAGCITDNLGNKCQYYQGECQNKTCYTALKIINNYRQCQDYDRTLDCVTSENGGCKNRPSICSGYVGEEDCCSIKDQGCIWINQQCELKQCYHAPPQYTHSECKLFGSCMGKLEGGCIAIPQKCEEIYQQGGCDENLLGQKCIWLNHQCILLSCNQLKLPNYSSNQACQLESPNCIINIQQFGCVDYICDNVSEEKDCTVDSKGNHCLLSPRCVQKQCDTAPFTFNSKQQCEDWMPECTINIFSQSTIQVVAGCIKKFQQCQLYQKEQCFSTIQDYICRWDISSNKCEDEVCSGADPSDYKTNEDCFNFKIASQKCVIGDSGLGCRKWPTSCSDMKIELQCNLNLENGEECFWSGTICKIKECSDASINLYKNNIECQKWMNNCIYNPQQRKCEKRLEYKKCNSSNSSMFNNHQECFAWNQNCTVVDNFNSEGCEKKKDNCSLYLVEQVCKSTIFGGSCYWDNHNQQCKDIDSSFSCQIEGISDLTHENCESFNSKCTIANITKDCVELQKECYLYKSKLECNINYNQQPCFWNDSDKKCKNLECVDNQTATTESECLNWRRNQQCILTLNQDGSAGKGCQNTPYSCSEITNPFKCNFTLTRQRKRCLYINKICQEVLCNTCENITQSKSNEECQSYNINCILKQSQQGCYCPLNCTNLSLSSCSSVKMSFNQVCYFNRTCNQKIYYWQPRRYCDQKNSSNQLTDQICYDWKYDCVLENKRCVKFDSQEIKLNYQCAQYQDYQWSSGKCKNIGDINCHENTTAVTNLECQLISSICGLNYIKGKGCAFIKCKSDQILKQSQCNSRHTIDGLGCIFNNGNCVSKLCSQYYDQSSCQIRYGYYKDDILLKCYWCNEICSNNNTCDTLIQGSPQEHSDCNKLNFLKTISVGNIMCTLKKASCSDYLYETGCQVTTDGIKCFWQNSICKNYCDAQDVSPLSNIICFQFHNQCMYQNNQCVLLNCTQLDQHNCSDLSQKCFWDGNNCLEIKSCQEFKNQSLCKVNYFQAPCFWDDINSKCIEKECSNIKVIPTSDMECDNWLKNCKFDSNSLTCVEQCESADNSYKSHQQCESYYPSKRCTLKVGLIQCVDLPQSCSLAKEPQCFQDSKGNECYYSTSKNKCVDLTCLVLEMQTHFDCNQRFKNCTVNKTLNGCQILDDCYNYEVKDQCYINNSFQECQWISHKNSCTLKQCSTAQLNDYSVQSCQQYFGKQCTVNQFFNGCIQASNNCNEYSHNQCISGLMINIKEISCFWDESKIQCVEYICENGPLATQTHNQCVEFMSSCQKGGCKQKSCFDYQYSEDQDCAQLFDDKRCASNGKSCIFRQQCEEVSSKDLCTFDLNLKPCDWLDGTCVQKKSCNNIVSKELCNVDVDDQNCVWDDVLNQCFSEQCIGFCGDGIIQINGEQCDDGNYLPYDGCYLCQFHCSYGCLECDQGQGCKKCDNQFILINETDTCQENQVLNDEIEDINEQVIIEIASLRCIENQILIGFQCVSQCGNGILNSKYEQCDDGNQIGGDGCSSVCSEEDLYQCQNYENSTSVCSYILPPDFILVSFSSKTNQTQLISLSFTQDVKLMSDLNFEEIAVISIIPETHAPINVKPIVNLSTTLNNPLYEITVEFIEPVKNSVLQIELAQSIIKNQFELDLVRKQIQISLGNPFVISETTKQKVTQIMLLNDIMIYSMIGISGLSLLTGNAIMFFNLLDLLQSLSYIKYMQYSFPPHLMQFLNTYTKVSLQPILERFQIEELFRSLNGGSLPFKSTSQSTQIQANPLNQFYLLNAQGCYFSILCSLAAYFISILLSSKKVLLFQRILYDKFKSNYTYLRFNTFYYTTIQKFCMKFRNEYFSFGIFKVYLAILHQLFFSVLLQFPDYSFNSPLMILNSVNAIIGLILISYFSLQLLSITQSKIKDKKKWKYFYQDSLPHFWAVNYKSFQIYKIMIYIFLIVEAINYPEIQSILLSMSSVFYLGYLFKFKPLQSQYEYIKLILREILFALITGSFLIYSFDIEQNYLILIGWIHICCFSLMLISNLSVDLIECIKNAWMNYKRKKELLELKEQKKFYVNKLQKFIKIDLITQN